MNINLPGLLKNNKGHILLELMIYLSIISMIFLTIFTTIKPFLNKIIDSSKYLDNKVQVEYCMEYILNEVKKADYIIEIKDKSNLDRRYPNNIGFVLVIKDRWDINYNSYRYILYSLDKDNLVRRAASGGKDYRPRPSSYTGNFMAKDIKLIDSKLNRSEMTVEIDLIGKYMSRKEIVALNFTLENR